MFVVSLSFKGLIPINNNFFKSEYSLYKLSFKRKTENFLRVSKDAMERIATKSKIKILHSSLEMLKKILVLEDLFDNLNTLST